MAYALAFLAIMNVAAFAAFADDKQITRLFLTKVAAERPGVDVRIEAFEPQEGGG